MAPWASYHSQLFGTRMDQHHSEQLARLWTESQPVVGAYILSLLPDFHQAEDVLQQVAVSLVREFDKYDPARPFLPWAMGIARNLALKSKREFAKGAEHVLGEALIDQIQDAFQEPSDTWGTVRKVLRTCIRKQPQKVLELLRWRYAYDLKPADVAVKMGITAATVRVMLHRAREVLRRCIKKNSDEAIEWM
jgi:RNA polymerase sigma-70 factor, ECF subfamily